MAINGRSFAERFSRWQVLAHNFKEAPVGGEALSEELAEIDTLLARARTLQDRQAQLRAESQRITKELGEVARQGDRIRSRVGSVLAGKLGFTSGSLVTYGFRPVKPPVRRRAAALPPPVGE